MLGDDDDCCTVYSRRGFFGHASQYCLGDQRQTANLIDLLRDVTRLGSIKCGKYVDAVICPGDFELGPVTDQRDLKYKCDSGSSANEPGIKVGAN
jgi:hypothetical protein